MKHMRKSAVCHVIMLMMFAQLLAGCSESAVQPEQEKTTQGGSSTIDQPIETEPEETTYADTLEKIDYDGAVYNIGGWAGLNLSPEDLTGETINDAVYDQMLKTKELYNIEIQVRDVSGQLVAASVAAQDNAYQVVLGGTNNFASMYILQNLVQNLFRFEQMDFSRPWWNQNCVNELTLNNKLYMATGDFACERGITYTHSFFFNKVLADNLQINDALLSACGESSIYEAVRNGKWTIDVLETIIEGTYQDLDGDGDSVKDFDDLYGLGQSIPVSGVYRTAFDCLIMARDADGWPVENINTDKFNAIVPRIYSLCFENPNVIEGEHAEEGKLGDTFVEGRLLLYSGFLMDVSKLREMEDEFGVLPFPKYDEQQTRYYTTVRGDNYFLGIPVTVGEADYDFVGRVTETLAFYGFDEVRPAVYEDTLKGKMTRDADSVEMLDILVDGIVVEFAFAHANDNSFSYVLWNLLNARMNSFSAYYKAKQRMANNYYKKVIDIYKSLE